MLSFGKRLDGVGGKRHAVREPILLAAAVTTFNSKAVNVVVNVSETGARLRGDKLPKQGEELILKVGEVDAFARVVWCGKDLCGVEFDEPISSQDVDHLRQEGQVHTTSKLTPEEQIAFDDWTTGKAR